MSEAYRKYIAANRARAVEVSDEEEFKLPRDHKITENFDYTTISEKPSMDRSLPATNLGFRMLLKMGWKENTSLGKLGTGLKEPLKIELKNDVLGLGKKEIDDWYTDPNNITRKALDVEVEETEEIKLKKKTILERDNARQQELTQIAKSFLCELCSKQYQNILQLETHLDSYDHHHRKRLAELKQKETALRKSNQRKNGRQTADDKHFEQMKAAAIAHTQQLATTNSQCIMVS